MRSASWARKGIGWRWRSSTWRGSSSSWSSCSGREQAARASAEQASRLKDQFLAIVSHELRTPLNAVLGWADVLRRGRIGDAQRAAALDAIYRSAKRQAQLIDDLLDVARIMSGKLRLDQTVVDFRGVIRDALLAVQPLTVAKRLEITVDADPGVSLIYADASRLQQVVANLLSNAVKFTPSGGALHLRLRQVDADVELEVADTGEGIPADFLPSVFEAFRQADGSTTRVQGGLGLGLSIVKHLVEAHRGSVRVRSDGPGRGATFTVRLPVGTGIPDGVAPAPAYTVECDPADRSLAGISVLVVDDDQESRERGRGPIAATRCRRADGGLRRARIRRAPARANRRAAGRHRDARRGWLFAVAPRARPAARRGRDDSGGRHYRPGPRRRSASGPPGRVSTSYAEADRSQRRSSQPCQSCTTDPPGHRFTETTGTERDPFTFLVSKGRPETRAAPRWFPRASPAAPSGRRRG